MKVAPNGKWRVSSRDFFKTLCEHCTRIDMAVAAGVPEAIEKVTPHKVDVSSLLWVMQGNEFERHIFDEIKSTLREDFVELAKPTMEQTLELLRAGTPVVAQGYLESDSPEYFWSGFPDLLLREDLSFIDGKIAQISEPSSQPKYVVWDVKGTSSPDPKYWMQVASYAEILATHGLASENDLGLIAKNGLTLRNSLTSSIAQLDEARNVLKQRLAKVTPSTITVDFIQGWRCEKPSVCDRKKMCCDYPGLCEQVREEEHSLHCLYGKNPVEKYEDAGVATYDDLLALEVAPAGIAASAFAQHQTWARVLKEEILNGPAYELTPRDSWLSIPTPTPDDMFFDIEWFNPVLTQGANVFMFGFVDSDEKFTSFDSLDEAEELANFQKFVSVAKAKMESNPNAHIYHFFSPEVEHTRKLAAKYEQLGEEVEFLISRMVDLCDVSKSMLYPGANSYSIKALERYYDADTKLNRKVNLVAGGADAMLLYYKATVIDTVNANRHMDIIRDYNKDDCLSTKLLRDWLRSL